MKVYLAQLNPTVGDLEGNATLVCEAIARARAAGAELAVFSELILQGYPPRDLLEKPSFMEQSAKALAKVAAAARGIEVVVGFAEPNPSPVGNPVFNSAAILRAGRVDGMARKTLLPTYDVFDEDRHFEPAPVRELHTLARIPAAVTICEDAWTDPGVFHRALYRSDPVAELVGLGGRLVINISASPYSIGRPGLREHLMQEQARRHRVPVICVNQVGGNDELLFDGSSVVVDDLGRTRVRLASFEVDESLVDLDRLPSPAAAPPTASVQDEVKSALVMGTRDYVRKCGFRDVVVGLSGGVDSAVTAALAAEALGADHVHGVAMPARYSSPASLADANDLARRLGIDFRVAPIDAIFQEYLDALAKEFAGRPADVTEENIQARIRGNVLMALSNKFGWLVLTTGNKSELAVGYCTLYGDMSGGLAVISDVPKTLVYGLAARINRDREIIPKSTLERAPSAELRPDQTDQDTLPPYAVLDEILRLYVEERQSGGQIVAAGYDAAVVRDVVDRVDHNEYKRKQAAPGLRITSKAFGLGRRMPIAQRFRET